MTCPSRTTGRPFKLSKKLLFLANVNFDASRHVLTKENQCHIIIENLDVDKLFYVDDKMDIVNKIYNEGW